MSTPEVHSPPEGVVQLTLSNKDTWRVAEKIRLAGLPPRCTLPTMPGDLVTSWEDLVQSGPEVCALIDAATGRRWTRHELDQAADDWLRANGTGGRLAGCRVVMAEPNGVRWFAVFLGLLRARAIPAPADPMSPVDSLRSTARTIGASWLWHGDSLEFLANGRRVRTAGACLIKLTSGSTGLPKALLFTHAQMMADGRQVCATMQIGPDDVNLAVIPLGHSYGLGNLVLPLLLQGTAVVCAASPLPHSLAEDCARWRPTIFPAVPTLLQAFVRCQVDRPKVSSLRRVISAGAPLTPTVAVAFAELTGCRVHGFYGSSETGGITYDRSGDSTLTGVSVGGPLEGVRLHMGRGRRFTVESEAVVGRGRYSPPDFGEINDRGELVLLGRSGRTVKIGGRRLDLAEVEQALLAVSGVRAACAMPHPLEPDRIAAAVESELGAYALREQLGAKIAAWKIPDRLISLPTMPVTARGKLDRRRLTALLFEPQR